MADTVNLELKKADRGDIREIWRMQTIAFAELLARYRDNETNPAAEKIEKIEARFLQPETTYYFIVADGVKVGAIRVVDHKDGIHRKRISPLFIMPEHRNRGYAQLAMRAAERIHGEHHWMLDTILQEEGNLHLYEKMGYHMTGEQKQINQRMTIVFLEKD